MSSTELAEARLLLERAVNRPMRFGTGDYDRWMSDARAFLARTEAVPPSEPKKCGKCLEGQFCRAPFEPCVPCRLPLGHAPTSDCKGRP
jgi:hypothetical protein